MSDTKDGMGIKGKVHYELRDEDGNLKDKGFCMNTITNWHDAVVCGRMHNQSTSYGTINYIWAGVGSGQGASDTDLDDGCGEAADERQAVTSATTSAGGDDNDLVIVGTISAGSCTKSITELGLFKSLGTNSDKMMCYNEPASAINKGASDTLTVTWTITYGAS